MKCGKHNKETIGVCTWCGREMCQKCIVLTDGKKMYCEVCAAGTIGKQIREKQLRMIKDMN